MYLGSNLHFLSKKIAFVLLLSVCIFEEMTILCFLTESTLQNVHRFCVQNLKLQYNYGSRNYE
jgi:hypothetical protein